MKILFRHSPAAAPRPSRPILSFTGRIVAISLFAVFATIGGSLSPWRQMILLQAYSYLMASLDSFHEKAGDMGRGGKINVLVIHTGCVPLVSDKDSPVVLAPSEPPPKFSDRTQLRRLIEKIAEQKPKAIGVDIDFSSNTFTPVSSQDESFFKQMLEISKRTPVYLGVFDRMAGDGAYFCGDPNFDPLAAAIPASPDDTLHMPISISAGKTPLRSLAYALASSKQKINHHIGAVSEEDGIKRVLVNYSQLESLRASTLFTVKPETIEDYKGYIKGNYVILGDALQPYSPNDTFRIPGQKTPVPGVYLHACALYTLVNEPIWELPLFLRLLADLTLCVLIPYALFFISRLHKKEEHEQFAEGEKFFGRAAAVVALAGIVLVLWLRLFWLDFLLISVVFKVGAFFFDWFISHPALPDADAPA